MDSLHQIMDTELQDIKPEVLGESPGVQLETGLHCSIKEEPEDKEILLNVYSHSPNVKNLQQNVDTNVQNETHGVQIQKVKLEKDDACLEKIDGTHSFEKTHTNIFEVDSHSKNMDTGLGTANKEIVVDKDRPEKLSSYSQGNEKIYIFEYTDPDFDDRNNENNYIVGEKRIIKQEIQEYFQDVKQPSCEKTDLTIENRKYDVENNDIKLENSFVNIQPTDMKSETEKRFQDESDLNMENGGSLIDRYNTNISSNYTDREESSSSSCFNSGEINCELADQVNIAICPHVCNLCKAKFKTRLLLSMHTCHGDKPLICGESDEEFTNSGAVTVNQPSSDEEQLETGNMSNNGLKLKNGEFLKQEMASHRSKRLHQCNECGKCFQTLSHVREHKLTHCAERSHQCNVCHETFETFTFLIQHMIIHSTERPHQCNVCGKAFKTFTEERVHMISHRTERPHQCTVCSKTFKTSTAARLHKAIHSGEHQHQCNVCEETFNSLVNLRNHMTLQHSEHRHQCIVCDKNYKHLVDLKKHMVSHCTAPPPPCNECGRVFKKVGFLKLHIRSVHNLDHPYQCSVCDTRFKRIYNLNKHTCPASGGPHQCSVCVKGFLTSFGLRQHMAIHITELPHQCEVCQKSFRSLRCLKTHKRSHKPAPKQLPQHMCDVCGKAFKTLRSVKAHMMGHSPVASSSKDA